LVSLYLIDCFYFFIKSKNRARVFECVSGGDKCLMLE